MNLDPLSVVAAFGAAWADHDLDTAMTYVDANCVFDATGPAPDGIRHVGRDEIRQAWKAIFDDPASTFEAEETFVAADRVVQRWRYSWVDGHIRGVDLYRVSASLITEKLSYVKG